MDEGSLVELVQLRAVAAESLVNPAVDVSDFYDTEQLSAALVELIDHYWATRGVTWEAA